MLQKDRAGGRVMRCAENRPKSQKVISLKSPPSEVCAALGRLYGKNVATLTDEDLKAAASGLVSAANLVTDRAMKSKLLALRANVVLPEMARRHSAVRCQAMPWK